MCEWRLEFLDPPGKIYMRIHAQIKTARRKETRTKLLIKDRTLSGALGGSAG